jgi:hypothetical protein
LCRKGVVDIWQENAFFEVLHSIEWVVPVFRLDLEKKIFLTRSNLNKNINIQAKEGWGERGEGERGRERRGGE